MGLLAAVALPANTVTNVWTCAENFESGFNVNICNRGQTNTTVRLALTLGEDPTDANWLEFDYVLPPSGVLERTGLTLSSGQKIYAFAASAAVSVSIYGVKTAN